MPHLFFSHNLCISHCALHSVHLYSHFNLMFDTKIPTSAFYSSLPLYSYKINEFQFWRMFSFCNRSSVSACMYIVYICFGCAAHMYCVYISVYLSLVFHKLEKISISWCRHFMWKYTLENILISHRITSYGEHLSVRIFCWKLVFCTQSMHCDLLPCQRFQTVCALFVLRITGQCFAK